MSIRTIIDKIQYKIYCWNIGGKIKKAIKPHEIKTLYQYLIDEGCTPEEEQQTCDELKGMNFV